MVIISSAKKPLIMFITFQNGHHTIFVNYEKQDKRETFAFFLKNKSFLKLNPENNGMRNKICERLDLPPGSLAYRKPGGKVKKSPRGTGR
jgi:hypothetical protein